MAAPSARARVIPSRLVRAAVSAGTVAAVTACGMVPADAGEREEVARNVILILADGMGEPQRDFLRLSLAGPTEDLAMDRLGFTGSIDPTPGVWDHVTDSAAAATTLSTGMPTAGGAVGVDADGEPLPTLLERARDAGKATGLVTTAEVTDVTPAAFAAHVAAVPEQIPEEPENAEESAETERRERETAIPRAIARQYLEESRVDVILGGGAARWSDLIEPARSLGYTTVSDAAQLRGAQADRLLGLFADGPMFEPGEPGEGSYAPAVPLPEMTRAALAALDRRETGFFLVVAEEGIDGMARRGNSALVLEAGRALDGAVREALAFQATDPGTLIVVAGAHETGGMILTASDPGTALAYDEGPLPATDSDQDLWVEWTSDGPTDEPVPIMAGGPGAEEFDGGFVSTHVFPRLLEAMGLRP